VRTIPRVGAFSSATALPPDHLSPSLPFLNASEGRPTSNVSQPFTRRRHWVINRNLPSRQKGKEREDDAQDFLDIPAWQTPREPSAVDFGSFSILAGALAEEMVRRGISSSTVGSLMDVKESLDQKVTLDLIKHSLDMEAKGPKAAETDESGVPQDMDVTNLLTKGYWTDERAGEAEEFIKDVVYGGVEGFAYVRSLAEFVCDYSRQEVCLLSTGDQAHINP
jgi:bromodomain-containing protein 7/9